MRFVSLADARSAYEAGVVDYMQESKYEMLVEPCLIPLLEGSSSNEVVREAVSSVN